MERGQGMTIVSRLDGVDGVATFTFDGGVTWMVGDRTQHRTPSDPPLEEITELEARALLVELTGPPRPTKGLTEKRGRLRR